VLYSKPVPKFFIIKNPAQPFSPGKSGKLAAGIGLFFYISARKRF
jgi:hypothetical protein